MRLIHDSITAGVVVIDPESRDPIVIASPDLPTRVIAERAARHLDTRRRLDLDHLLHGGLPTRWLYVACWAGVGCLLGICTTIAVVMAVENHPRRPALLPPASSVPAGQPGTSASAPTTTRGEPSPKGGALVPPPSTTPPTTQAPPTTKRTPPGQVGKVGPYGLIRHGARGAVTTTTMDPEVLEELCDMLDLPEPCPPVEGS